MSELHIIIVLCVVILVLVMIISVLLVILIHRNGYGQERVNSWSGTIYAHGIGDRKKRARSQWRIVLLNMQTGQQYRIILNRPIVVGRSIMDGTVLNDIGVGPSQTISRRQFQMYEMAGKVYLQNLSRVNGTCVNDKLLEQPIMLQQGDVIQAAGVFLRVSMMWLAQEA